MRKIREVLRLVRVIPCSGPTVRSCDHLFWPHPDHGLRYVEVERTSTIGGQRGDQGGALRAYQT